MKARHRRVQLRDLRAHVVNVDDLYRVRPWPKPRRQRRLRRRRAARRAAMTPEARALEDLIIRELHAGLTAELNAQILFGTGTPGENNQWVREQFVDTNRSARVFGFEAPTGIYTMEARSWSRT